MNAATVIILAGLIAAGMKFVSFAKDITSKDFNGIVTQILVWVVGTALVFLIAASDFAPQIEILPGVYTAGLNAASKVILGILLLSLGSTIYDWRKARDNNDTAVEPPLIPPAN